MTPQEASVDLGIIQDHIDRLLRVKYEPFVTVKSTTLYEMLDSAMRLRAFISPIRARKSPRHPPKVPSYPARRPSETGCARPLGALE